MCFWYDFVSVLTHKLLLPCDHSNIHEQQIVVAKEIEIVCFKNKPLWSWSTLSQVSDITPFYLKLQVHF